MKHCFLLVLAVFSLTPHGLAELIPPGTYHEQGRVVEKADGQLAVFWGSHGYLFPKPLQETLRPYLGKFVDVSYTQVADSAGHFSFSGSEIGTITKVDVKADDPAHLPITITLQPAKGSFGLAEPVVVHVSVTNRTDLPQQIALGVGVTSLCQDYERRIEIDWIKGDYTSDQAHEKPADLRSPTLAPGQTLEFDMISQYMVPPGTYQAIYKTYGGPATDYGNQSEVAAVSVAPAKDQAAEHEALKTWLKTANYFQRVEIAEGLLLRFHDPAGTQEVLRLLGRGAYSDERHWGPSAFRYAWKDGGKEGEKVMLDLIENQRRQGMVDHLLEDIGWSPDHVALLNQLLICKNTTFRDEDSWAGTPRICDMTAAYLRGYPWEVKIKYPKKGTDAEKDQAIEEIKATLKEHPEALHIPAMTYLEDRTLGEAKQVSSKLN